jgi:hypothetical protein
VGMFDHRRQWDFETSADKPACLAAFREALTGRSLGDAFRMTGRWDLLAQGETTVRARYKGRGGVMRGITPVSNLASQEQTAAKGSELTFQVSAGGEGGDRTTCSMWLSHRAVVSIGFIPLTADARFIRGSMRQVARRLQASDPTTVLVKH